MSIDFFELSYKKYIFLGSICIAENYFAYWWLGGHPMWLLLAAAFWGALFFTPLAMDIVPRIFAARREKRMEDVQGVHYMFGRTAVRVMYSSSSDLVWVPTEDVCDALGLKLGKEELRRMQNGKVHAIIPGTEIIGISEARLRAFALSTRSPEAQRFVLWFEREVVKPIRYKVEQRMRVPEEVD
jgi:hypothetical protein